MKINYLTTGIYDGSHIRNKISVEEIRQGVKPEEIVIGGQRTGMETGVILNRIMDWDVPETITLWIDPDAEEREFQAYVTMEDMFGISLFNEMIAEDVVIGEKEIPELFSLVDDLMEMKAVEFGITA